MIASASGCFGLLLGSGCWFWLLVLAGSGWFWVLAACFWRVLPGSGCFCDCFWLFFWLLAAGLFYLVLVASVTASGCCFWLLLGSGWV
jgi:hypothetical protein